MPSEKILSEKQAYVAALREKLMNSVAGVVVEYKGISVADDTKLRAELPHGPHNPSSSPAQRIPGSE